MSLGQCQFCPSAERRHYLLLKLNPKLGEMATSEAGAEAKGNLFGDAFVKQLTQFVQAVMAKDKAEDSLKRVFNPKVYFCTFL